MRGTFASGGISGRRTVRRQTISKANLAAKSFSRIWAPYSVLSYSNNLTPRLVMAVGASWLGELNDQISLEKNVLIQLTAGEMAEPRTRREFLNSGTRRGGSDHLPQHFGRHASSPDPACFVCCSTERARLR